ncbi:melanoma antigen preferentially expressed in tumors-like [Suncus etruscus]|uniref:melanoma antigen preferentially expressed in tumors-like n=1 Tax=Suncus etruscus TaxID=109475 RepID=UPI00210F4F37|nr:melanoma antigen preferentially expressed in tumors-like [Suncus etruscus]
MEQMNEDSIPTLLESATKSLISDERTGMRALELLPKHLFIPLFTTAIKCRQKNMLKEIVKSWPFQCLHIGSLNIDDSAYDLLEALVDGLQVHSEQNLSSGGPKLRVLDLRSIRDCEITCYYRAQNASCFHSCVYSQNSILTVEESQNSDRCIELSASETENVSSRHTIELIVNISFRCGSRIRQFIQFLKKKIQQSSGHLHLCCRKLHINSMCVHTRKVLFLQPACINSLDMNQVHLMDLTNLFPRLIHLHRLRLIALPFQYCEGRNFQLFLAWLGKLDSLQDLCLSFFYLTGHLDRLLSVLQSQLDSLSLPSCNLSHRDVTVLSQSAQLNHITQLNLSDNNLFQGSYHSFQILLQRASRTLQHLEIRNCQITDSIFSAILSNLSHCSELRVFCFSFNPISMRALKAFLQKITACMKLQRVVYPIPLDCYEEENFHTTINNQKLNEVQAQVKLMLQVAKREDMYWSIFTD